MRTTVPQPVADALPQFGKTPTNLVISPSPFSFCQFLMLPNPGLSIVRPTCSEQSQAAQASLPCCNFYFQFANAKHLPPLFFGAAKCSL